MLTLGASVTVPAEEQSGWIDLPGDRSFKMLLPGEGPTWYNVTASFVMRNDDLLDLKDGRDSVSVVLPTSTLNHTTVLLDRTETLVNRTFAVTGIAPKGTTPAPSSIYTTDVHLYTADDGAGTSVRATAVEAGGVIVRGSLEGMDLILDTWSRGWEPRNLTSDGQFLSYVGIGGPVQTTDSECMIDCPGDDELPGAGASVSYGFAHMGEAKWCTDNHGDWGAKMLDLKQEVNDGFDGTAADMGRVMDHCWTAEDADGNPVPQTAYDCDAGDAVCVDEQDHDYVYNGNDAWCVRYRKDVQDDWEHFNTHFGTDITPDLAQTLHFDGDELGDIGGGLCQTGANPDEFACGGARRPGKTSVARALVAPEDETDQADDPFCAGYVPSHEFGHNFDAEHQEGPGDTWECHDVFTCGTLMTIRPDVDIRRNHFNAETNLTIQDCVLDDACGPNEAWP